MIRPDATGQPGTVALIDRGVIMPHSKL